MRPAPHAKQQSQAFRPPIVSLFYSGIWFAAMWQLYLLGQRGWEWCLALAFGACWLGLANMVKASDDWFKKRAHRRRKKRFEAGKRDHGQSRFATCQEIANAEILSDRQGIFVGTIKTGKGSHRDVFYDGEQSISVIAPAGEQKTTSIVIPSVIANPGHNLIINDPSGEVLSICKPALLKAGYELVVITPFADKVGELIGQKVTDVGLDIFSSLRPDMNPADVRSEIHKIGHWQMPNDPHIDEKSKYFFRAGRGISGFGAMADLVEGRKPTLTSVRSRLMLGPGLLHDLFQDAEDSTAFGGVYAELARSLSGVLTAAPQQFAGGFGVAEQYLDPFDHFSALGQHTAGSTFDPRTLKNPRKKIAVFVVYTLEMMETYKAPLAMTMNYLLDTVASDNQPGKVTAILDEAAILRMPLADKLDFYRKMGLRVMMIWQDMAQAEHNHGKTGMRRIMAASKLKIGMGLQEPDTLELFSKLCGTQAIADISLADRSMMTDSMPDLSPGHNHRSVPLFRPEEIRTMSREELLVVGGNLHPFILKKLPYWKRAKWNQIAGRSPYYREQHDVAS